MVITVSTRAAAGVYADEAGPLVATVLREAGYEVGDPVVAQGGLAPLTTVLGAGAAGPAGQ